MIRTHDDATARGRTSGVQTISGLAVDLAEVLGKMIDQRDPYTGSHMSRVAWLSVHIGIKIGEAKIIAVADVAESMISHRPYRPALPKKRAIHELTEGRGTRYDPLIVDACLHLLDQDSFNLPNEVPDFGQTRDRT